MSDVQKKIRAVRNLRRLIQPQVAALAHIHYKTYQRMEAGTSPVTEDMLETLAAVFNCTADDIRHFNLETNQFETPAQTLPEEERLKLENALLKAENAYLKRLLDKVLADDPDFLKKEGGI